MTDPKMAIGELEYAVRELGFKTAVFAGHARRAVGDPGGVAYRLDTFGVDSAFDYDPLWAKCVELGVAPVFHSSLQSHRVTRSATSYVYNHVGGLAANHESLCKSLFLSGVTHRFPELRFGFLEGGVAWACALFSDLVGHWEKRNAASIGTLDPDRLDVDALMELFGQFGDERVRGSLDALRTYFARPAARPEQLDEFAAAGLRTRRLTFAIGSCPTSISAARPTTAWSRGRSPRTSIPLGARFRPIFGSDISHWDVPDMTEAGRGGVRARGRRRDRRARVRRAHVREPGATARRDESVVLRRYSDRHVNWRLSRYIASHAYHAVCRQSSRSAQLHSHAERGLVPGRILRPLRGMDERHREPARRSSRASTSSRSTRRRRSSRSCSSRCCRTARRVPTRQRSTNSTRSPTGLPI